MPTALNDLLQATSRSFYLTLRVLPARRQHSCSRVLQGHRPCAMIRKGMKQSEFQSSPWCAFAPGKEAWKRAGNYFTSEELRQIDNADDLAIYQPLDPVLSAD